MPFRNASRATTVALLPALVLGAATACIPLPIPHMAQATPPVTGTLYASDGTPVAGERVAATDHERDRSCTRAGGRAITDARGRFAMPEVKVRRRIFWFTMMENFGMTGYWLCAGPADSAMGTAPRQRSNVAGHFLGDTVACLEWRWREAERLACNSSRLDRVVTGGTWSEGGSSGWYRLILHGDYDARVFVQWVEPGPAGTPLDVRATAELPTGDPVETWYGTQLAGRADRWRVTVSSMKKTKWGNERLLRFELGPPGVIRELPE